jgi:hypothetical protein
MTFLEGGGGLPFQRYQQQKIHNETEQRWWFCGDRYIYWKGIELV